MKHASRIRPRRALDYRDAYACLRQPKFLEWRGRTAVGADGSKLGKIEEIYLDAETRRPEWALIQTGMFGGKSSFMPLEGATGESEQVQAPFSKEQVKDAPQLEPDGELSHQDEAALYSHYGIDYDESRSDSGLPDGGASTGDQHRDRTDEAGTVRSPLADQIARSRARTCWARAPECWCRFRPFPPGSGKTTWPDLEASDAFRPPDPACPPARESRGLSGGAP